MTRYLIEDLNTHCDYEFCDYTVAHKKYNDLLNASPNPQLIMTSFTPDYLHSVTVKHVIQSTI